VAKTTSTSYDWFTFNGTIDEVRAWNIIRSSGNIQHYMNYYLTGNETVLSGYWQMNEGNSIFVQDSSPNFNDGVILDPIWTHGKELSPVSIDGYDEYNSMLSKVIPNPCKNSLEISFFCEKSAKVEINVYNIRGQRVKMLTDNTYQ